MATADELRFALLTDAEVPRPCVICGEVTHNRGIWEMGEETVKQMLAPPRPDQTRYIIYAACGRCFRKHVGKDTVIEDKLIAEWNANVAQRH